MTRTIDKHTRFYADGYDWSGYTRSVGPLVWTYEEGDQTCLTDACKNVLLGQASVGIGTLNGVMDNTATTGLHILANGANVMRTVMIPIGFNAAPAQGDPVYMGEFEQKDYMGVTGNISTYATVTFSGSSLRGSTFLYDKPWGILLHAKGAETAVNSANGVSDMITPASTAFGGYMVYQVFAGNGTATIKVQDATSAGGAYSDVSGLTSGVIDCSTVKYGRVAIGRTATIRAYTRWQIVLGTATTVTFALGLVRATF